MKVLALTRYGREGASSRIRFLQFIPPLAAAGVDVEVRPLWDPGYLQGWYRDGTRSVSRTLARYARRAWTLVCEAPRADVVWLEAEAFPYLPSWAEGAVRVPYVVDYDDAVYEKYNQGLRTRLVRGKIESVMRGAARVIAGNDEIAAHARACGARGVVVLPTVVDVARYPVVAPPPSPPLRVCWIGTPHTARYLDLVADALRLAAQRVPLRLVTIGANITIPGVEVERHAWSEETEAKLISGCHVGIMPLPDAPWERGKSGYKLIQYMAAERPVIASPVGVNVKIVDGIGRLARSTQEWVEALVSLAEAGDARAALGAAGRDRVDRRYSVTAVAADLIQVLRDAHAGGARKSRSA